MNNNSSAKNTSDITGVNHSLARTIGRITEENPKRIKGPGATIDLSRKTTKDIPSFNASENNSGSLEKAKTQADELLARIAAIEKSEQQSRVKTVCRTCGHSMNGAEKRLTCLACGKYLEVSESAAEGAQWSHAVRKSLTDFAGLNETAANVHDRERIALRKYVLKRVAAKVVDSVIVSSLVALEVVLSFGVARSLSVVPEAAALMVGLLSIGVPLLALVTVLGYQAVFEASPVQATPGKLWLGLYVTDGDGGSVRCEKVVFKTIVSLLPLAAFLLVYAHFYNARLKFGLGLDSASASVLAMTTLACIATYLSMHILTGAGGKSRKQTIVPDLLCGSVVQERE